MEPVKQKDGMLRVKPRTKKFLLDLKIKTNANSLDQLLWVIFQCPQVPDFVFDFYRDRAFDLTPQQIEAYESENQIKPIGTIVAEYPERKVIQLDKNKFLVKH